MERQCEKIDVGCSPLDNLHESAKVALRDRLILLADDHFNNGHMDDDEALLTPLLAAIGYLDLELKPPYERVLAPYVNLLKRKVVFPATTTRLTRLSRYSYWWVADAYARSES